MKRNLVLVFVGDELISPPFTTDALGSAKHFESPGRMESKIS